MRPASRVLQKSSKLPELDGFSGIWQHEALAEIPVDLGVPDGADGPTSAR